MTPGSELHDARILPPLYEGQKYETKCPVLPITEITDTPVTYLPLDDEGVDKDPGELRTPTCGRDNNNIEDEDMSPSEDRPSNGKLLMVAFFSFLGFAICQTAAAFIAKSQSMKGDSAAMFVDSLTYLFNYMAERRKDSFDERWVETGSELDPVRAKQVREQARRKMTLQLELIPPLISVVILTVVTVLILHTSIQILVTEQHQSRSDQTQPNVTLMLTFSIINLALDVLNVCCFAKAKHLFGYRTIHVHSTTCYTESLKESMAKTQHDESVTRHALGLNAEYTTESDRLEAQTFQRSKVPTNDEVGSGLHQDKEPRSSPTPSEDPSSERNASQSAADVIAQHSSEITVTENLRRRRRDDDGNLNMCSAYTHVFADTLRSIAVIVAAVVGKIFEGITAEEADAAAAVVVSGLILFSLLPLVRGLVLTFTELISLR